MPMRREQDRWRAEGYGPYPDYHPELHNKTIRYQVSSEGANVKHRVKDEEMDSDDRPYTYQRGARLMLSKFIKDKDFPVVNFDVTNDYFSDLSSECLKYHMFVNDLGHLETFANQIPDGLNFEEAIVDIKDWVIEFRYRTDKSMMAFMSIGEGIYAEIVQNRDKVSFNVAADSKEKLEAIHELADVLFPITIVSQASDTIPVAFWAAGPQGPVARTKKINPLHWNDIANNYTDSTRSGIEDLIMVRPPIEGGRLIMWHGEPGTGKSSAIRSLIHTWLPWCNASYVVDPEQFFGSANYMLSVLLDKSSDNDFNFDMGEDPVPNDESLVLQRNERWNLLIIEDADEFLRADAKDRTGQALSRLLNLADGLIGQGLNFMVLITTNELMKNIHKAVQREGRCMAENEFYKFTRDEAKMWLGDNADLLGQGKYKDTSEYKRVSLAQLYDMRRDRQQIKELKEEHNPGVYI